MPTIFLSYSKKDRFFAEVADLKLADKGIKLWRDQGQLRAGSDWRQGIERGIASSLAVIVALSDYSAESPYVTYEWAYALGMGKTVIPVKLTECPIHPKLEPVQYLDFAGPGALPWDALIERVREIETEGKSAGAIAATDAKASAPVGWHAQAILTYLDQRGYQMASFDRLCKRVDAKLTKEQLNDIITNNPSVFRHATLAGGKPGIAKIIP